MAEALIESGWAFHNYPDFLETELKTMYRQPQSGWIRAYLNEVIGNQFKCQMPGSFKHFHEQLMDFHIRHDDIFICAYPRSGASWVQEIVWQMVNNKGGDTNNITEPIHLRTPLLEADGILDSPESFKEFKDHMYKNGYRHNQSYLDFIQDSNPKQQRVIKTRMPRYMMPKGMDSVKKIYVLRNPIDVYMSYYKWHANIYKSMKFKGYSSQFYLTMRDGDAMYGCLTDHPVKWINFDDGRKRPNVLVVHYSELQMHLFETIKKIGNYLNINLDADDMRKIAKRSDYEVMRKQNFDFMDTKTKMKLYSAEYLKAEAEGIQKNEPHTTANVQIFESSRYIRTLLSDEMKRNFRDMIIGLRLGEDNLDECRNDLNHPSPGGFGRIKNVKPEKIVIEENIIVVTPATRFQ